MFSSPFLCGDLRYLFCPNTVELDYNDLNLFDTLTLALYFLWYQLIPIMHTFFCLA